MGWRPCLSMMLGGLATVLERLSKSWPSISCYSLCGWVEAPSLNGRNHTTIRKAVPPDDLEVISWGCVCSSVCVCMSVCLSVCMYVRLCLFVCLCVCRYASEYVVWYYIYLCKKALVMVLLALSQASVSYTSNIDLRLNIRLIVSCFCFLLLWISRPSYWFYQFLAVCVCVAIHKLLFTVWLGWSAELKRSKPHNI